MSYKVTNPMMYPSSYSGTPSTNQPWIPSDPSFVFSITSVKPNGNHHQESRYFEPPTESNALSRVRQSQYLWRGGVVRAVETDAPQQQYLFSEVTVFTQMPDTPNLLAVNFDAATINVSDRCQWRVLSFEHVPPIGSSGTNYSSVQVAGSERHLAAPGARHWVPQLLPTIYDYPRTDHEGRSLSASTTSAGLIGSLPLLLALAAFSGPENQLDSILTQSLQPGVWASHTNDRGDQPDRGLVVKVYRDPMNPAGSTSERLTQLQGGRFGPFYGH